MAKFLFYFGYLLGGGILSFFLPAEIRFVLGFLFALLTAWAYKTVSGGEVRNG